MADNSTKRWRALFRRSKLGNVRHISYDRPDRNLIEAIVERWHPETNTFHMPFGEMTITLDDVYCLTGLEVDGLPVQAPALDTKNARELVCEMLSVTDDEAEESMRGKRGATMKLEWLRETFMNDIRSTDPDRLVYAARAYLLYIFGCSLFTDKTGSRVSVAYLRLLDDLTQLHHYAWGAATLAYLYRALGEASRYGTKQICGYMTLLEVTHISQFLFIFFMLRIICI